MTYLAYDRSLDRRVAIKEYLPNDWASRRPDGAVGPRSASQEEVYSWGFDRFLKEARDLAQLRHPNVVQVHDVIEARGTAYMVTEYVEGRSLAEALQAEGPWPESRGRSRWGLRRRRAAMTTRVHDMGSRCGLSRWVRRK